MILHPSEMPSRGIDPKSEALNIPILGFSDLIEYTRNMEATTTEIGKYLLDVELVRSKIHNWKSINLIDLDYIIFMIKKLAVSSGSEFTVEKVCTDCNEVNTLYLNTESLAMPTSLIYDIKGVAIIRDVKWIVEVPNLEEFYPILTKIDKFKKVKELRLLKLISLFPEFKRQPNLIEDMIVNAHTDDIVVLQALEYMFLDSSIELPHSCTNCREGRWSMKVNTLIDQVFRSMVLSSSADGSKVIFKQVR